MLDVCLEAPCTHQHSLLKAAKSEGRDEQQQQQKQRRSVAWTSGTGICMIMGTAPYHWRRDAACLLLYSAGVSKQTPHLTLYFIQVSLKKKYTAAKTAYSIMNVRSEVTVNKTVCNSQASKHLMRPLMRGDAETK